VKGRDPTLEQGQKVFKKTTTKAISFVILNQDIEVICDEWMRDVVVLILHHHDVLQVLLY